MSAQKPYRNRRHAGAVLASRFAPRAGPDARVLALPRGGVPVAWEIARELHAPLDVFVVRKLGVPDQPELAMGAIASGDVRVLNEEVIALCKISSQEIAEVTAAEAVKLHRWEAMYRRGRPRVEISGHTVLLVDDGLATGASMRAAITAVRRQEPKNVMVGVPVGARETCDLIAAEVDELVCPLCPDQFDAVGQWYEDFAPTSDREVRACLDKAAGVTGRERFDRPDLPAE